MGKIYNAREKEKIVAGFRRKNEVRFYTVQPGRIRLKPATLACGDHSIAWILPLRGNPSTISWSGDGGLGDMYQEEGFLETMRR